MAKRSLTDMVQLTAQVPRGHDGFWAVMLDLDAKGPWTLTQLDEATNVNRASSKDYVHRLERAGFVERVGQQPGKKGIAMATLWSLVKKPLEAPRLDRQGNELQEPLTQLLWRTMRILKTFDCVGLRDAAELPDRAIGLNTARHYVAHLASVGILVTPEAKPGKTAVYTLVRDLGPKSPSVGRMAVVFDRNSRQIVGKPVVEVQA